MNIDCKFLILIITLGILTAITSISVDIYLPAFGKIANHFNVEIENIETTITIYLLGMALGQMITGPISDLTGRQVPLRIGLGLYILSSICCVFTGSFAFLLVLRFFQGLGGSTIQAISRAIVSDTFKNKSAQIFTILQIIMGVSPILAPMLGGIVTAHFEWQYLFAIMAIVSSLGLLGCLIILPSEKPKTKLRTINLKELTNGYNRCIKNSSFINFALVRALSNSAAFILITGAPLVFMKLYGLNEQQFGFLFSGLGFGVVAAGMLNIRLLKKLSADIITKSAIIFQAIAGIGMIISMFFHAPLPVLILCIFLFISMLGFILPNVTALYIKNFPNDSGTAAAVIGTSSYLFSFILTLMLSRIGSYTTMVCMMVCCNVLAYFCNTYRK